MSFSSSHSFDCSDDDDALQTSSDIQGKSRGANSENAKGNDGNDQSTNITSSDVLFAGMGNIAAACDAANAVNRKPFRSDQAKLDARRRANRRSAKMSRDRKKVESDELQMKANRLTRANLELTIENQGLRRQVSELVERLAAGAHAPKTGGLSGFMTRVGTMEQQDLLSLQMFQLQHSVPINQQQTDASPGARSIASAFGLQSMMSPNLALIQGSQLAANTLQLAAAERLPQYNQMRIITALDITSMGDSDRNEATDVNRRKRQKVNANELM
jgi:hypothetical protein